MLIEVVERISPQTHRKSTVYRMQCEACGDIYESSKCYALRYEGKRHFCSRDCYVKHKREHPECWPNNAHAMNTPSAKAKSAARIKEKASRGEWRHWLGKHHSEETKRHLSEISLGGKRAGKNNGMHGRTHTEVARERMSEAKSRAITAGTFRPQGTQNKKGWHESTKTGRRCFFRSSWEEIVMRRLDEDSSVKTWDYECLRLPYYYGEHKRWYVPDFLVTFAGGNRELWEVKPAKLIETERVQRTSAAAIAYCQAHDMLFKFITKSVLSEWSSEIHVVESVDKS